ncbi:MAG: glycine cleavage system aminomethyltransferase GcvT [Planctomycetaceae bacterium]
MDTQLQRSPLHSQHLSLGARMVPFAGWEMPVQYTGIIPEHTAVRSGLGVFDISHMGQLLVTGSAPQAACNWLDSLLTNNAGKLQPGEGQYSVLLNESGGVIDDLIVYRQNETDYFLVVNASKTSEDFVWMQARLPTADVSLVNQSATFAAMAVQGPNSVAASRQLFSDNSVLPDRFCMAVLPTESGDVIVCRTGYTGEDGFELFCPVVDAEHWWQKCLDAGATPAGLGARDTLRLEKCYPLNGNDLSPEHTPLEAGLGFAVDLTKADFVGKSVLAQQKSAGLARKLVAIRQLDRSPPPRPGYAVFHGEEQVGTLTSGGVSPSLGCGISLAYIEQPHFTIGTALDVEIRGKRFPAEVVKKPFV